MDDAEAFAGGVVKDDAVFVARPDGVVFQQSGALHMDEEAARFAPADDRRVLHGRLVGVKMIFLAKYVVDMFQKEFNRG